MEKEGAIKLLKYHQGLRETKVKRLTQQLEEARQVWYAIKTEIAEREKERAGAEKEWAGAVI